MRSGHREVWSTDEVALKCWLKDATSAPPAPFPPAWMAHPCQICVHKHITGQSGSHAWKLHLPMQLLRRLTQALQTIKQEDENAGNSGPYWLETDYESLYILRQQYIEHNEDNIT